MENDIIYKINNLVFYYDKKFILDIPDFKFYSNKIYLILGANGSGKTTLLKILNGLIRVDNNKVFFKNISIEKNNYKLIREKSVYVHQHPYILEGTVYYNIIYGLKIRKISKSIIEERLKIITEELNLQNLLYKKSDQLSIGEIQKVCLARAIILEPEVLLLDEPVANLDIQTMPIIKNFFKKINKKKNTTIILTSHNTEFGSDIADETLLIENKKINKL